MKHLPPPPHSSRTAPDSGDGWGGPVILTPSTPLNESDSSRRVIPRWLWIVAIVLLITIPVGIAGWFAGVFFRTHQHLAAMVIPTASPTFPATASPTFTPTESPTFTPTESPTFTTTIAMSPILSPTLFPTLSPTPPLTATMGEVLEEELVDLMPPLHLITPTFFPTPPTPTPWPTIQSLPPVRPVSWPTVPAEAGGVPIPSTFSSPSPLSKSPDTVPTLGPSAPGKPQKLSHTAVTFLFLGNDRRPGEQDIPRTDTILLMIAEPERNRIALLSLPRDLWVDIPGYGANRINAAYVWGEVYQAPGGGMELARQTVQHLLGIEIDYVTMVDFAGFIGLIDILGGIPVEVEKELFDASFPTMNYGYQTVHFLPGTQHMDGMTALIYSRIRHPDSDFVRITRQQAVLIGIGNRLRERGDLQNLATIDQITGALTGFVQTTIPESHMAQLLWTFRDMDPAQVERYAVGGEMVSWGVGSDAYALVVSRPVLNALVARFVGEGIRNETLP